MSVILSIDDLPESAIEKLEKMVMAQLKKYIPFLTTELCPADFTERKITEPVGVLLVRFLATDYNEPENGLQKTKHLVEVMLCIRAVVGNNNVHRVLELIKDTLSALKPEGTAGRMFITHEQLIRKEGQIWQYGQMFSTNGTYKLDNSKLRT